MKKNIQIIMQGIFIFYYLLLLSNCSSNVKKVNIGQDVYIEMVLVEAGTFMMGTEESEIESLNQLHQTSGFNIERQYKVTITRDYYIGKYQVTQEQWKVVMGNNPSRFKGDDLPVENVSWYDAQDFIKKLNELTGKKFSLPTEAEWEFAARGGNRSRGYLYSGSNNIHRVGWYSENSNKRTHTVGSKRPNELKIYDMSGNVWEWCADWFGDYPSGHVTDPTGVSYGEERVLRGGGWTSYCGASCRVANRSRTNPSVRSFNHGFRLVLRK